MREIAWPTVHPQILGPKSDHMIFGLSYEVHSLLSTQITIVLIPE